MSDPGSFTLSTTRPDEAAEAIRQGFGYDVAISAGELSYRQHVLLGDTITASDLHLGARLSLDLDPTNEVMLVDVHSGTYTYNPWGVERTIGAGGLFVMPPDQSMSFDIDHADVSTMSFSLDVLREVARGIFDMEVESLAVGADQTRDPAHAWLWRQVAGGYRRHVLEGGQAVESELHTLEASRWIVVSAITAFGLVEEPRRDVPSSAALARAIRYVDDNLRSPVTTHDIAAAARLSPRGLVNAFQRERGQTPMQYVRAGRLAGARADLLAADPTRGGTVAAVAVAWGFTNAGRFTAHYREAFGESPRDTLIR